MWGQACRVDDERPVVTVADRGNPISRRVWNFPSLNGYAPLSYSLGLSPNLALTNVSLHAVLNSPSPVSSRWCTQPIPCALTEGRAGAVQPMVRQGY